MDTIQETPCKENSKRAREPFRGDSHSNVASKDDYPRQALPRDKDLRTPSNHRTSPQEITSSSRNKQLPSSRGDPLLKYNSDPRPEEVEKALGKTKDTLTLYSKCTDPSESAARRERLRQAEAQGVIKDNFVRMVRASINHEHTVDTPEEPLGLGSQERTPISVRLGSINVEPPSCRHVPIAARLGPPIEDTMEMEPLPPMADERSSDRISISARLSHSVMSEVYGGVEY